VLTATLACGGEPAPAAPTHPPPREVLALSVRVESGSDRFCQALEAGLARSGITISSDRGQAVDAVITCHTMANEDDSFIRITSNGETRMRFTVRVQVVSAQNVQVDQFVADYKGYKSEPDEEAVAKTVVAFAYSRRIAAFAQAAKSTTPVPVTTAVPTETAETASVDPPPRHDTRDDTTWFAIDTVKCKIPARVDACDRVRQYMQRFPDGAHAREATEILNAAQPALEKLQKDDVAWQKSNHYDCASRRTTDACVGVEAYEMQFPTGQHADEARRLLKSRH
jgi:hypothetical protein